MTISLTTIPTPTGQRIETKTGKLVSSIDYCAVSRRFETWHTATSKNEAFRKLEAAQYWMLATEIEHQANLDATIASLVA